MQKYFYLMILAILPACGGGGGGDSSAPANQFNNTVSSSSNTSSTSSSVTNQAVGGLWYGTDADGDRIDLFISESGAFHFITSYTNNLGTCYWKMLQLRKCYGDR